MKKINSNSEKWGRIIWLSELFQRYYNGLATDKEKEVVENWDPEMGSQPDLRFLNKTADTDKMWGSISKELNFQNKPKKERMARLAGNYYKYAAAIVVLLGTGFCFLKLTSYNQYLASDKSYYTSGAQIKSITLSDGSVVRLNTDTKLAIVEEDFNDDKREVWLEEGEAFFEVAKNPEKPFIVHTQSIMTTVKGTSFNIKAYKELDDNVLSVRSGKVEVSLDNEVVGLFTKNKRMTYHKNTRLYDKDEVSWEDAAAWTEGRLVMKRANLKEFRLRLKQQYGGVDVEIKDNALGNTLLNASFEKGAKLETVLEGISMLYGVKYRIVNNKVIIYK